MVMSRGTREYGRENMAVVPVFLLIVSFPGPETQYCEPLGT